MSNDKIVLALLKEVRDDQKGHTIVLVKMKSDICRNADDLKTHMEQTKSVKELVLNHQEEWDARLAKVESPFKFIYSINSFILKIGALAGAVYVIAKALSYI